MSSYVTMEQTTVPDPLNDATPPVGFEFTDYKQRAIVAAIFFLVFVTGTIGNSLTILSVLLTKKLQNATNTLVINLAISDLIACLFIPWTIFGLLYEGETFPNKLTVICAVAGGVLFVSVGTSFWTLAAIALNRLILITYPKHTYNKIFGKKTIFLWIVLIWAIPCSFTLIPPLVGVGALGFNPKYKTCSDISAGYHENGSQTYDFIQAGGVFPIPLVILVVSYTRIIYFVRSHSKKFVTREIVMPQKREPPTQSEVFTEIPPSSSDTADNAYNGRTRKISVAVSVESMTQLDTSKDATVFRKPKRMSRRELQVTKNLFIIFCAFIICLLPYSVVLVVDTSDPVTPYAAALLLLNSCINPIIYATRFPNFKMIFKLILKCQWHAIPEPSWLLLQCKSVCGCCSAQYV